MELRQSKPIHMKCPKCGHDFSFNGNRVVQDIQEQKNRMAQIDKAIAEAKSNNIEKDTPYYKRLIRHKKDCAMQLVALKNVRRNLVENAEIEKYKVFYNLVKQVLGEKKTVDLVKEAEESIVYRDYDMAIQKHNNFEKA